MHLLATADETRAMDREAISTYRIPGIVLMENAGRACVDFLQQEFSTFSHLSVAVVCGKGNNGGDGFVISRHLTNLGARVDVFLLVSPRVIKGDAKTNLSILTKIVKKSQKVKIKQIRSAFPSSKSYDIIIDAIFGTGFSGNVQGLHLKAVQWMNNSGKKVVSVDIASGVNAATGAVGNAAVMAHATVTMGVRKIGQCVGEGRVRTGSMVLADIGIPSTVETRARCHLVEGKDVSASFPAISSRAHKYARGKLLIIGGSRKYTGAPAMTAQAAMRTGTGATILAIPEGIHEVLARKLTEVMLVCCTETSSGALHRDAIPGLLERAQWADAVAIGPGLSRDEETLALVRELLRRIDRPVLVDADALFALKGHHHLLKRRKAATVLTPHYGEFSDLTRVGIEETESDPVSISRRYAKSLKSVLILKGAPTIIGTTTGEVYVNSTGNPGMATIGSGDVLTGIVGSLLAQGIEAEQASIAGVFVHGLAGDLAAKKHGTRSLMALDIAAAVPSAIKALSE